MEFRLFGEVEVSAAGQRLDVGTPRQQAVLAALVVDARRPVAIGRLIDQVWDDRPPVGARNVLYSHLSRVRQLLRTAAAMAGGTTAWVERRHAGYVLNLDPDTVDIHRFQRLVNQGCDPERADPARAEALTEALRVWRAPPLASFQGEWAAQVRGNWHRLRLDAAVQWAQVQLGLGRPAIVIAALHELVVEYPLVEPLEGLLMRALHAAGRGAEAIDRYAVVRHRLADELGVDPGLPLRELHRQILTADPALGSPAAASLAIGSPAAVAPRPAPVAAVPRQLPAPPCSFAGRTDELLRLDALLGEGGERPAVVISALLGMAGIGKTALAVHWAHRAADRFPDGQLYVNLRGFDPGGQALDPAQAIRGFLDALGVAAQRIPTDLDGQQALYRSLLADKRVLIVLDNARDAGQVRPLLPGNRTVVVLVTSRNQLSGLVAADGARPLTLDQLSCDEARQLLAQRLGGERLAAEPSAVNDIIAHCARLPLALTIVAARAATNPHFALATLAAELHDTPDRLNALSAGEAATDIRAVFSWSYRTLAPDAARLFRLLGVHPGPDISAPAAASLAGLSPTVTRPLLAELTRANLIIEHTPGRYCLHDLLRAYAAEQANRVDSDEQRHAAVHRMLDHYLHTADTADRLLHPARDAVRLSPRHPGISPEQPADYRQALAWFTAEGPVLLAAIEYAAATGFDAHTAQLAWALRVFLYWRGRWHDQAAVGRTAVAAADRLAEPSAQARAHLNLAYAYAQLDRLDDTDIHLRQALELSCRVGDLSGQAHAHQRLAYLSARTGCPARALEHARRALDLYEAAGHRPGVALALNLVGWYSALLGDHQQALTYCQQALALHEELGNRDEQGITWDSLGYAHHHLGHHTEAITCYHHALTLIRSLGDAYNEADVLTHLGDTHHAAGNARTAREAWRHALAILEDLGHPEATGVRARLAAGRAPTASDTTEQTRFTGPARPAQQVVQR